MPNVVVFSKHPRSTPLERESVLEEGIPLANITVNPRVECDDVTARKPTHHRVHRGLLYTGVLLLLAGVLIIVFDPIGALVRWQTSFREGTFMFGLWKESPVNNTVGIYIFNYTNSQAFLEGKEKLRIEEIGPYVYNYFVNFQNITFNNNNTFSFSQKTGVSSEPMKSDGNPKEDFITVPNMALLGMSSYLADASFLTNMGFNMFANYLDSKPFLTMTVDDFLWGYDEPLLEYASKIMPNAYPSSKIGFLSTMFVETDHVAMVNSNLEKEIRADGRVIAPLTIDTYDGSAGLTHYGYDDEDNSTHLPCNTLQGVAHDGGRIASKVNNLSEVIQPYQKAMCRPLPYKYGGPTHTILGVPAQFFNLTEDMFKNSLPENSCFCLDEKSCLPDGLLDVSPCFFDMPIAYSAPHFLYGDTKLREAWENLSPNEEEHKTYAVLDTETGLLMELHTRLQVNLALKDMTSNWKVEPLRNMVLPMVWIHFTLDEIPLFYHCLLYFVNLVVPVFKNVVIAMLLIAGCISIFFYITRSFKLRRY